MRKKRAPKRYIKPDPRFGDYSLAKFINAIMEDGQKETARSVVYDAFTIVEEKTTKPAIDIFKKALQNVQPVIEVRSRRVGGATYQVPMEVRPERRMALAIRWLKRYASDRKDKTMANKLANELIDASNNSGNAVKKKEDTHRMAEANQAFAHFRY